MLVYSLNLSFLTQKHFEKFEMKRNDILNEKKWKWNEMKWNNEIEIEMKWNEMKWNGMELNWIELNWIEMKLNDKMIKLN